MNPGPSSDKGNLQNQQQAHKQKREYFHCLTFVALLASFGSFVSSDLFITSPSLLVLISVIIRPLPLHFYTTFFQYQLCQFPTVLQGKCPLPPSIELRSSPKTIGSTKQHSVQSLQNFTATFFFIIICCLVIGRNMGRGSQLTEKCIIHSVVCLTTGAQLPTKRVLHTVRSTASSFKFQYPLVSLTSATDVFFFVFLSLRSFPLSFFQYRVLKGSSYTKDDQPNQPSSFPLNVGHFFTLSLYVRGRFK